MWEHIAGLKGDTTIVLTTHYLEEADALADRIAVIDEGKVIALGTPGELKGGLSEAPVTVVEAANLTDEALASLREIYPVVRTIDGGVEIEADEVSVYAVGDCLRPFGIEIQSTYKKTGDPRRRVPGAHRKGAPRMRYAELAKRNFKEVWRDPLSLALTIGLPVLMLVVLQALGGVDEFFEATSLAPGVTLFGFVMLMFSAAMTISRDRESALFSRLLTTPLRPRDFVSGYSLPYLPVAAIQAAVIFGIGLLFGLEVAGSIVLVVADTAPDGNSVHRPRDDHRRPLHATSRCRSST